VLAAVRQPRLRMVLTFIYHTGLRVGEAVRVEVRDLQDTQTDHPRLHVRCGKGGKDRYVRWRAAGRRLAPVVENPPASAMALPGPGTNWRERGLSATQAAARATTHLSVSAVQNTFRLARPRRDCRWRPRCIRCGIATRRICSKKAWTCV